MRFLWVLLVSMQLVPVCFKRVETDSVLVGEACEESTNELNGLYDEKNDAKDCINLSNSCLPECKVSC